MYQQKNPLAKKDYLLILCVPHTLLVTRVHAKHLTFFFPTLYTCVDYEYEVV